jgi:hypothetical protein
VYQRFAGCGGLLFNIETLRDVNLSGRMSLLAPCRGSLVVGLNDLVWLYAEPSIEIVIDLLRRLKAKVRRWPQSVEDALHSFERRWGMNGGTTYLLKIRGMSLSALVFADAELMRCTQRTRGLRTSDPNKH